MFDGYELSQELDNALSANVEAIHLMETYGKSKAQKEADYHVALASAILDIQANGGAASTAEKIAKGRKEVAEKFVDWQCEEALFRAANENIMLHKRRADVARERMQREWAATGGRAL